MKNPEKSWIFSDFSAIRIIQLRSNMFSVETLQISSLSTFQDPFRISGFHSRLALWHCNHRTISISHWSIIFIDSSLYLCLAKRTVNCAVPGDLPLLLFASLCAVQAPGKHYNDQSCYAISMACLSQSKRQQVKSHNSCYSLWPWFAIRACFT